MSNEEKLERYDREIADLKKRVERVEDELGIVHVDDAGVPDKGERRPRPQQEN